MVRGKILSVKLQILGMKDWIGFEQSTLIFDLILLDLAMPDFSGFDVIKSLKQDGLLESKNIVIFTASSNQDLLYEVRNNGVKEIFKKPFSLDQLIALIEKYRPGIK